MILAPAVSLKTKKKTNSKIGMRGGGSKIFFFLSLSLSIIYAMLLLCVCKTIFFLKTHPHRLVK